MNTLKFLTVGGWPFVLDDLNWLQGGWITNQQNLISFISNDLTKAVRLKGAELDTTAHTVQDGFMAFGGLVYPVDYHSYTAPGVGEVAYWKVVEYDAGITAGVKIFQDTTTHDVYSYARLEVHVDTSVPVDGIDIANTIYVGDVLRDVVNTKTWNLFSFNDSDFFYGAGLTPNQYKRRYFKDIDGFVHLKGGYYLDDISSPTDKLVGQLPVGFRPPHDFLIPCLMPMTDEISYFAYVQVEASNGNVTILGARGNGMFLLNQIPPISIKS